MLARLVEPIMGAVTPGLARIHARATCAMLAFLRFARSSTLDRCVRENVMGEDKDYEQRPYRLRMVGVTSFRKRPIFLRNRSGCLELLREHIERVRVCLHACRSIITHWPRKESAGERRPWNGAYTK